MTQRVIHGNCIEIMAGMEPDSVDACVTDPPYHLTSIVKRFGSPNAAPAKSNGATGVYSRVSRGFMGQQWDGGDISFRAETWAAVRRILKPGAHLVAFGGSRNYHRLACAIEDAGFEIRDQLLWLHSQGFPKSLDVSKAIDRARDDYEDVCRVALWLRPHVERAGFDVVTRHFGFKDQTMARTRWTSQSQPQVPTWEQWLELKALCDFDDEMDAEVWRLNGRKGTPGEAWLEREIIGRGKACFTPETAWSRSLASDYDITAPATEAARQWQGWGTALKPSHEPIVLARRPLSEGTVAANVLRHGTGALNIDASRVASASPYVSPRTPMKIRRTDRGQDGKTNDGRDADNWDRYTAQWQVGGEKGTARWPPNVLHDGSPEVLDAFARFGESSSSASYRGERNGTIYGGGKGPSGPDGLRGHHDTGTAARFFPALGFAEDELRFIYEAKADAGERAGTTHVTVKPIAVMEWLIKLICPSGGTVLDPFAGSLTTLIAAERLGFNAIGIELDEGHIREGEERMRRHRARRAIGKAERVEAHPDQLGLFG